MNTTNDICRVVDRRRRECTSDVSDVEPGKEFSDCDDGSINVHEDSCQSGGPIDKQSECFESKISDDCFCAVGDFEVPLNLNLSLDNLSLGDLNQNECHPGCSDEETEGACNMYNKIKKHEHSDSLTECDPNPSCLTPGTDTNFEKLFINDSNNLGNEYITSDLPKKSLDNFVTVEDSMKNELPVAASFSEITNLDEITEVSFTDLGNLSSNEEYALISENDLVHRKNISPNVVGTLPTQDDINLRPTTYNCVIEDTPAVSGYENLFLCNYETFVEEMLQACRESTGSFHELLDDYLRESNRQISHESDLMCLETSVTKTQEELWHSQRRVQPQQGRCQDGATVKAEFTYSIIEYNSKAEKKMERCLENICTLLRESLSLHAFNTQMNKLRIEWFLYEFYAERPFLSDIPRNAPVRVCAAYSRNADDEKQVADLKSLISTLFHFHRLPSLHAEYAQHVVKALSHGLATLLRVALPKDHLFILHHILRCPPGIHSWATQFVCMVLPSALDDAMVILDLAVAQLASICKSVTGRKEFLTKRIAQQQHPEAVKEDDKADDPWILVDGYGEEGELQFSEEDLHPLDVLALLRQINFNEILRLASSELCHSARGSFSQIISFSSEILSLLNEGLHTYCSGKHLQSHQLLAGMICILTDFVIVKVTDQTTCKEFDDFICEVVKCLLLAPKLNYWSFLSCLPYHKLSMEASWEALWLLIENFVGCGEEPLPQEKFRVLEVLKTSVFEEALFEKLSWMSNQECICFIEAMAQLALTHSDSCELLHVVALLIFQTSVLCTHTSEICEDDGSKLLCSLFYANPDIIMVLLHKIQLSIEVFTQSGLTFISNLPLSSWRPSSADLGMLLLWLSDTPPGSMLSRLAQIMLSGLDWSKSSLIPVIRDQQVVASLLQTLEVHHLSGMHVNYLRDGVVHGSALTMEGLGASAQLVEWTWNLVLNLRLHPSTLPTAASFEAKNLHIQLDTLLYTFSKSAKEHRPLALFVVLCLDPQLHSASSFLEKGLTYLYQLIDQQFLLPAIHVIHNIQRNLIPSSKASLSVDQLFLQKLNLLLSSGQSSAAEASQTSKLFLSMIQCSCRGASGDDIAKIVSFWIHILTKIPQWNFNINMISVIDGLLLTLNVCNVASPEIHQLFVQLVTLSLHEKPDKTLLSSLAHWVTGSSTSRSIFHSETCSSFPFFAMIVLHVEAELQEDVLVPLQTQLHINHLIKLPQALQIVFDETGLEVISPHQLVIFHLALQCANMDPSHPLLVQFVQLFFQFFLARPGSTSGMPTRGSCGNRYFQGNENILNNMEKNMRVASDFYYNQVSSLKENDTSFRLWKFYQAADHWLVEPRLHSADLYLPALPIEFEAHRLVTLLEGTKELWLDLQQPEKLQRLHADSCALWSQHVQQQAGLSPTSSEFERIRPLKIDLGLACEMPALCETMKAPITLLDHSVLLQDSQLLDILDPNFSSIINFAKAYSHKLNTVVGLDFMMVELVPQLWHNEWTESHVTAACTSLKPLHRCSGPLHMTVKHQQEKLSTTIERKMYENRAEYKQLVISLSVPPPPNICKAVLRIQTAIRELVKLRSSAAARQSGVSLFFQLHELVSEEVQFYLPSWQFLSSCSESLGESFIESNGKEMLHLLEVIQRRPMFSSLLVLHFTPSACPQSYCLIYRRVLSLISHAGPDICFSLLTKFNLSDWLSLVDASPVLSCQVAELIQVNVEAILSLGASHSQILEVLFTHFQCLLRHRFPVHFSQILKFLLQGTVSKRMPKRMWNLFLDFINLPEASGVISQQQVEESVSIVASHFFKIRLSSSDCGNFGLYSSFASYVAPLSTFVGWLSLSALRLQPVNSSLLPVWQLMCTVYSPWLIPVLVNQTLQMAWLEADRQHASSFLSSFVETVKKLQAAAAVVGECPLNWLWHFYLTELCPPGTVGHVIETVNHELRLLEWHQLVPTTSLLTSILLAHSSHSNLAFEMAGFVLNTVDWPSVISCLHEPIPPFLAVLFNLLVRIAAVKELMELPETSYFIQSIQARINWQLIPEQDFEAGVQWFLHNADPQIVLAVHGSNISQILGLMKGCAGMNPLCSAFYDSADVFSKQVIVLRMLSSLICRCSHFSNLPMELFERFMANTLTEVESLLPYHQPALYDQICRPLLSILNNCESGSSVTTCLLHSLISWIADSGQSQLVPVLLRAACMNMASVEHLCQVLEACLESYLCEHDGGSADWGFLLTLLSLPAVSLRELLDAGVAHGSFLLLYGHLLQQLPLCQSPEDEMTHIQTITKWLTAAQPNERWDMKVILSMCEALRLIRRQLEFGYIDRVMPVVRQLIVVLQYWAEDRQTKGLWGVVGMGKKSTLSVRFRLFCRAMAVFLMMQTSGEDPRMTEDCEFSAIAGPANQALCQLEACVYNKSYCSMEKDIGEFIQFIKDKKNTLIHSDTFCLLIAKNLFIHKLLNILFSERSC